jgi:hypothetical protein
MVPFGCRGCSPAVSRVNPPVIANSSFARSLQGFRQCWMRLVCYGIGDCADVPSAATRFSPPRAGDVAVGKAVAEALLAFPILNDFDEGRAYDFDPVCHIRNLSRCVTGRGDARAHPGPKRSNPQAVGLAMLMSCGVGVAHV